MARQVEKRNPSISIVFTGWLDKEHLEQLYLETDLLVVPSLWPEPFAMVGLEAGLFGVPAVAFNVGGISDWLLDGVNGHLAPSPPDSSGLAEAVWKCLHDQDIYNALRRGATDRARATNMETHVAALLNVFNSVLLDANRPLREASVSE